MDAEWACWVSCTVHCRGSKDTSRSSDKYRLRLLFACFIFLNPPGPTDKLQTTTVNWNKEAGNQPAQGLHMTQAWRLWTWLSVKPELSFTDTGNTLINHEWRRSGILGKRSSSFPDLLTLKSQVTSTDGTECYPDGSGFLKWQLFWKIITKPALRSTSFYNQVTQYL